MQELGHQRPPPTTGNHSLETADAVARAAHLWIRSLCVTEHLNALERQAVASGLVAGLCDRLALDPMIQNLVAYVYALLDDEGAQALSISRMMLDRPVATKHRVAFKRGQSEAAAIAEMLAYHRKSM